MRYVKSLFRNIQKQYNISKSTKCFNVRSSTYYFYMKTNFQICISISFFVLFWIFIFDQTLHADKFDGVGFKYDNRFLNLPAQIPK